MTKEKHQLKKQNTKNPQFYLNEGNSAFRNGNYSDAVRLFKSALIKTPELASTILFNISIAEKRAAEFDSAYNELKSKKVIVYTCNFGNYESIKEPLVADPNVEYILFTDNKNLTSKNWRVIVLNEQLEDPRRTSRLPKIQPHKYLPPHDISVYIDSSLEMKVGDVKKMILECLEGKDIALYSHYKRDCVYDEIEFVMNSTDRVVHNKNLCLAAIEKYKSIDYPKNNGLFENAFIIRRNTKDIQSLSELWWNEYILGTERDQFTFMYALWITGIKPNAIKHGQQFRINNYVNFHKHTYRSHADLRKNKNEPHIFIAYAPKSYGMNLGRCYNEYMERIGDDDFALFIDHDAMFVSDSWKDIINDVATKHADEIALFISRTNRINNPYQRLNLLEENHRVEDHRIFAEQLSQRFSSETTECSKLPSSSGVIIMLSKKTWKKHKFSDGFLKVDNKIHLSHRESGDPVYLMNGLGVYHFYRADNDISHAVKDISSLPREDNTAIGHVVRNFVYKDFSIAEIDRYMNTLKDDEYGVFLPEQSIFCNKDWYIRIVDILEKDKNIGFMVFNDNDLDDRAPIELDALKHKIYSTNMIERETSCLHDLGSALLSGERRAFLLSKKIWKTASHTTTHSSVFDLLLSSALQTKQKAKFVPNIYVFNSKIDHRKKVITNYLDKQLNVGILTMGFWPQQAGMEMMVHNLATQITKAGSNVVLYTPKPKAEFEELKSNYIIRRFKDFEDMKRIFREHHAAMPFDVLYVQGAYEPASLALELKQELRIPVILRTHGEDIQIDLESGYGYRRDPKKNEIILRNIRNVDHNVVIGPHILKDVKELTEGPVSLIFNGVDTDHFKPGKESLLHERLGLAKETKILITVGRNVKKKSLHLAIDALALVKKSTPNVVLVHAGKEGNGLNLREYAISKGVSDAFHQIGEVSYFDMPEIYRSADIFIFPSKTETFGNVTVEAMACGLPCIEFDYEVNRDKITDGKTGFIVQYGDCEKLAEKILLPLNDEKLCEIMSINSRKHAVNKFSWRIVREQYRKIFFSSLDQGEKS
jgi:glycosyltransferase involved in cell wall biosynthesis/tetratricopeptide (TPR) repeat protein